jgi:hypothetical protein
MPYPFLYIKCSYTFLSIWLMIYSVCEESSEKFKVGSSLSDQVSFLFIKIQKGKCGHTRKYRIRNDDIRDKLRIAPIQEKLVQHRLRWFGHIQQRPHEAPVRSGILSCPENIRRGRCRSRLT